MYTNIEAVKVAESRATQFALEDRARYVPFFAAAEKFAIGHQLIIGDSAASLLLTGQKELGIDDYSYTFYSGEAKRAARELTTVLYDLKKNDVKLADFYVYMMTEVPSEEFVIRVDERPLFTIKTLRVRRGVALRDVFVPSMVSGFFVKSNRQLMCVGPELQLIQIYADLCNPTLASSWGRLVDTEAKLRALLLKNLPAKTETILGGAKELSPQILVKKLRDEFAGKSGRVLLEVSKDQKRLHVVTSNSLAEDEAAVRALAKKYGYARTESTTNKPDVPGSARLARLTMYLVYPNKRRIPFIDIYNAAQYEVVPFVTKGKSLLKQGTYFVRLRFLLVDLWIIQLLLRMQSINADFARRILTEVITKYHEVAGEYVSALSSARTPDDFSQIFPLHESDYIGSYEDPRTAQKRRVLLMRRKGQFPVPFYPALATKRD